MLLVLQSSSSSASRSQKQMKQRVSQTTPTLCATASRVLLGFRGEILLMRLSDGDPNESRRIQSMKRARTPTPMSCVTLLTSSNEV